MTTLEPDTTAAITATVTTYLDAVARGSSADIAALYAENAKTRSAANPESARQQSPSSTALSRAVRKRRNC